jgi:hypothetical protein
MQLALHGGQTGQLLYLRLLIDLRDLSAFQGEGITVLDGSADLGNFALNHLDLVLKLLAALLGKLFLFLL